MNTHISVFEKLIDYFKNEEAIIGVALGGSRSKNTEQYDSDYDIFIVVDSLKFDTFLKNVSNQIQSAIEEIIFFGKDKYLEDWGYMYCGIDNSGVFYDLAFISDKRINEMCIRSHNRVLFDKSGILKCEIFNAVDINYQSLSFIEDKLVDVKKMIYINYVRYIKYYHKKDYWMAFRFLNLIRENIMKFERINLKRPSKLFFLPEEKFEKETNNTNLKLNFTIDGSFETLNQTAKNITKHYYLYFPNDPVLKRIMSIYRYEI